MPEIIDKIKEKIIPNKENEKNKSEEKSKVEEKIDIEEKINKKTETFGDKMNAWFNRIDILELEQEEKGEVAKKVKLQAKADKLYRLEIFLSGIIASLGLLQNSVAVIIGAMLIAPFLRPINGIAFGIARGEKKFFFNSVKVLLISSLVSVVMGFIVMNLTGLYKETPEILARTSPNIIDLFIAIFSAVVALLSLGYKRLGESVAGVAMAAALMPPLGVIGMELALGNYTLAWGATMLFVTNIVAIVLVGVGAFWLYGFTPHNGGKQKKAFVRIFLTVFLILLISVPLFKNLLFLRDKEFVENRINTELHTVLSKQISHFNIYDIKIKELDRKKIAIEVQIKIEEGTKIYDDLEFFVEKELKNIIGREVDIRIDSIVGAKFLSKEEEDKKLKEIKNRRLEELKNDKIKANEYTKKQQEYIDSVKEDFKKEMKKKFEEEINGKLKHDIEEKLKQELEIKVKKELEKDLNIKFNILLEEKIKELQKTKIFEIKKIKEKTGSGILSGSGKSVK